MELVQFCYNPHNKDDVITVCDADIASYLSGEHQTLHICFLVSIISLFYNVRFFRSINTQLNKNFEWM